MKSVTSHHGAGGLPRSVGACSASRLVHLHLGLDQHLLVDIMYHLVNQVIRGFDKGLVCRL